MLKNMVKDYKATGLEYSVKATWHKIMKGIDRFISTLMFCFEVYKSIKEITIEPQTLYLVFDWTQQYTVIRNAQNIVLSVNLRTASRSILFV